MPGKNLYPRRRSPDDLLQKQASKKPTSDVCVFLSHRSSDKPTARLVAQVLSELDIDYYLDEDDVELQVAQKYGDHVAVVRCIEDGLAHSSHLLGIITPKTKGSWWVPFEIGAARAHSYRLRGEEPGKRLAYIVENSVTDLPEFMGVSTLLSAESEFEQWLKGLALFMWLIEDRLIKQASAPRLSSILGTYSRKLRFTK